MSSEPRLPAAHIPESLKVEEVEQDDGQLPPVEIMKPVNVTKLAGRRTSEPRTEDQSKVAIESCVHTGEVMDALFPEGLNLNNDHEFAVFRLFDRLVGDVANFARTGMTRPASLHDITMHAKLLQDLLNQRSQPDREIPA
jgi:hypothetical protein